MYGWTTEFWDIVHAATGEKQSTLFWYTGPTDAQALAVLHWLDQFDDEQTAGFVDWYPYEHPELGPIELGGWNTLTSWTNPPPHLLLAEVDKHADFAVAQALAAPCIRIRSARVEPVGPATWRVTVGISNTGWLPTTVTEHARKQNLVEPMIADIRADAEMWVIDGPERRKLGQLAGASAAQFTGSTSSTPDRTTCSWLIEAVAGTHVSVAVHHQRAGTDHVVLALDAPFGHVTTDAWITLVVLVATFGVLAFDRLPAAAAMGAAVGVLLLADVVDQSEALSGLSSSAPVTIAALYVLAGAATVTGALSPVIDRLLAGSGGNNGSGSSRARLGRLAVASGAMSAVLPNTPLVALAAPRVVTWCRRSSVSVSPYLIPLSYSAVFGGVVTVIGTSTNLVVSDLLVAQGEDALGVFEITGVGLPVAAVGIGVLVLTAPRLLRGQPTSHDAAESDVAQRYTIALTVEPGGPLVGQTVDAAGLRHLHGVFLAGVERGGAVVPARPGTVLGPATSVISPATWSTWSICSKFVDS